MKVSVVIPTYQREQVLVDTLHALLRQTTPPSEILVVDQTPKHEPDVHAQLQAWSDLGVVRWIKRETPGIVEAMNTGFAQACGGIVLFLDDDILPVDELVEMHVQAHELHPDVWAVAGQVLQPGEEPAIGSGRGTTTGLRADLDFCFNASEPSEKIKNVMAGNLSVKREAVRDLGGFDTNYLPPISFRFESDFARRIVAAGGSIRFEPSASIRHLAAPRGGTRSRGCHLRSASPVHGVGDYYFARCHGRGIERMMYMLRRPFREVRTKFHLRHPWWIPVKLVGEFRALIMALGLKPGTSGDAGKAGDA